MPADFEPDMPTEERAARWTILLNSKVEVQEVVPVNFFDTVCKIVDETEAVVADASLEISEMEEDGVYTTGRPHEQIDDAYREAFDKIAHLVAKGRGQI